MGLDMYLRGEKFFWTNWKNPASNRQEDGFKVHSLHIELGYWRKHPDLHGFIVENFANAEDNCEPVDLDAKALRTIIGAINSSELPHTEGFFFGASSNDAQERAEAIAIFEAAIKWIEAGEPKSESRSVYYQASW